MTNSVFLALPPAVAGHIATALRAHREWGVRVGMAIPPEVQDLERQLTSTARSGQRGSSLDDLWELRDRPRMNPRLLDFKQVAEALSCSERTVQRLVDSGALRVVRLSAAMPRVRVADLDAYVASLSEGSAA